MKRARILIARELIEAALTTDGDTRQLITKAGLPEGSRLVEASVKNTGTKKNPALALVLDFEHESFPEAKEPTVLTPVVATVDKDAAE